MAKIDRLDIRPPSEHRLAKLLEDIAARLDKQTTFNNQLLEQVAELHLRVRYLMETFKYKKPSLLVGVPDEQTTLYKLYVSGDRERFLSNLERLTHESLQAGADEAAERPSTASPNGAGNSTVSLIVGEDGKREDSRR